MIGGIKFIALWFITSVLMLAMTLLLAWVLATFFFLIGAHAAPPPGALDPELHAWFERQHSVVGAWCCNEADGHILSDDDWRGVGDHYEVRIADAWLSVPDTALRDTAGGRNSTGHAIVWFTSNEFGVRLYCFAPGTEY